MAVIVSGRTPAGFFIRACMTVSFRILMVAGVRVTSAPYRLSLVRRKPTERCDECVGRHNSGEIVKRGHTVSESDVLVERFEENRPRLRAVAYRVLGSLAEADDAVQEAWLRLSRTH